MANVISKAKVSDLTAKMIQKMAQGEFDSVVILEKYIYDFKVTPEEGRVTIAKLGPVNPLPKPKLTPEEEAFGGQTIATVPPGTWDNESVYGRAIKSLGNSVARLDNGQTTTKAMVLKSILDPNSDALVTDVKTFMLSLPKKTQQLLSDAQGYG